MNELWKRFKTWFKGLPWLLGLAGALLFGFVMGAIFKTDLLWWEYALSITFGGVITMVSYRIGD